MNPEQIEAARAVGDISKQEAEEALVLGRPLPPWNAQRAEAAAAAPGLPGLIVGEANKPDHYMRFKIEPIRFIQENKLSPLQGKVVKYVTRYPFKNGVVDLQKAKRCIEMLIELERGNPDWWK